jgi:hypothetical protein
MQDAVLNNHLPLNSILESLILPGSGARLDRAEIVN